MAYVQLRLERAAEARARLRKKGGAGAAFANFGGNTYATQGSNPRLAGRVPGRSATHTFEPRFGPDPDPNPHPNRPAKEGMLFQPGGSLLDAYQRLVLQVTAAAPSPQPTAHRSERHPLSS